MVLGAALKATGLTFIAAAFALVAMPAMTAAQATPAAGVIEPKPTECLVMPRKLQPPSEATPVAPGPGVLPTADSVPVGEPAPEADAAAVTATVREALACRNAGDVRRAYALFTDDMIYTLLGGDPGPAPELLYLLENRNERPLRGERLELVSVANVGILPDGKLRAEVVTANAETTFTDVLVFAGQDGRWLIDESIAMGREPRP